MSAIPWRTSDVALYGQGTSCCGVGLTATNRIRKDHRSRPPRASGLLCWLFCSDLLGRTRVKILGLAGPFRTPPIALRQCSIGTTRLSQKFLAQLRAAGLVEEDGEWTVRLGQAVAAWTPRTITALRRHHHLLTSPLRTRGAS